MAPSESTCDDKRILNYHDEILHRSDLQILRGPSYINDHIISFYFTHLYHSLFKHFPHSSLSLVPHLHLMPQLPLDPHPLDLHLKSLILFPINDNPAVVEGGMSLLVYDQSSNEFVHHDGANGPNRWRARRLYEVVKGFVGGDGDARFVEGRTLQQRECGLLVMKLARWFVSGRRGGEEERWFGTLEEEVDAEKVGRLRGEVLMLIMSLVEENE